jgi:chemotaxis protein CheD
MAQRVIGIGDCCVSSDNSDELVTYALGSCIGISVYDPVARVGGLLHYLLPNSILDKKKAEANPYLFADSGIPLLFHRAYSHGAQKERLITRVAGGSQMSMTGGIWNVGEKNAAAARQILSRAGVRVQSEAVGGSAARTVRLSVETGEMSVTEMSGNSKKVFLACMAGSL